MSPISSCPKKAPHVNVGGAVKCRCAEPTSRRLAKQLEAEDPNLAAELQKLIITMLGVQLMKTTRAVGTIAG